MQQHFCGTARKNPVYWENHLLHNLKPSLGEEYSYHETIKDVTFNSMVHWTILCFWEPEDEPDELLVLVEADFSAKYILKHSLMISRLVQIGKTCQHHL